MDRVNECLLAPAVKLSSRDEHFLKAEHFDMYFLKIHIGAQLRLRSV